MHCFNESAPLANIFDCMKGHNRKLNRLRGRERNGGGAVKSQDKFFIQTDWSGGGGTSGAGGWGGLVWTRKAASYIVTVPWLLSLLPSIQLCIIGLVSDGLLLPLIVMAHPSQALTRQRKKS